MVKEAIQKTTPLEGRRQCKKKLTYGGGGGRMRAKSRFVPVYPRLDGFGELAKNKEKYNQ